MCHIVPLIAFTYGKSSIYSFMIIFFGTECNRGLERSQRSFYIVKLSLTAYRHGISKLLKKGLSQENTRTFKGRRSSYIRNVFFRI